MDFIERKDNPSVLGMFQDARQKQGLDIAMNVFHVTMYPARNRRRT